MAKKKSKNSTAATSSRQVKKPRAAKGNRSPKSASGKKSASKRNNSRKDTTRKETVKKTAGRVTANKAAGQKKKPSQKSPKPSATVPPSTSPISNIKYPVPKQLTSPDFVGKPKKLPRDQFPEDSTAKEFRCYGPPATEDGLFEGVRICDLGCFTQDGKDSNKYYHGAVVQHKKSLNWYAYFEWGRTGGSSYSYQFVACQSEEDAQRFFAKQLSAKNDKRGEWVTVAGFKTLRAKKGKDCYLVRPMATRTTGLPDARNIKFSRKKSTSRNNDNDCPKTVKLLRDLQLATIAFTRKSMADSSVPTQRAVDEARQILAEAHSEVAQFEAEDFEGQIQNKKIRRLTELMFSRIPRKKKVGAPAESWLLMGNNLLTWQDDLDAYESALRAIVVETDPKFDILTDMNIEMNWIDPDSKLGGFLFDWCQRATVNRHQRMKGMEILNIWSVNQKQVEGALEKSQKRILRSTIDTKIKPRHQPRARLDLETVARKIYKSSNTHLLFHGTRSVNVNAILRESLRMPKSLVAVAITGEKFGPGIYFSDDWKKSADYTNARGAAETDGRGAVKGRHAFLFLADVVLGNPHIAPKIHGYTKPPRGYHSVYAKAGHSGIDDNEFVVYKKDQNRLRYLVEFKSL